MTRRTMLETVAASSVLSLSAADTRAADSNIAQKGAQSVSVAIKVNGHDEYLTLDSRTTLLDCLREHLHLTGTKKGCDHGQCGACTVLAGGNRILSCLTLAASVREPVTTIEGLAGSENILHPMQQAFIDQDA